LPSSRTPIFSDWPLRGRDDGALFETSKAIDEMR
jgi:hypothetical protein